MKEKVTIAIPTYNRKDLLLETVDSAIKQTYKNIEIIISDNNSIDGTKELIKEVLTKNTYSNIQYYRQNSNIGMVANWNFCLEHATGEYFIMLSDDDLLVENAVEKFVQSIGENISLIIGNFFYIDSDGVKIKNNHSYNNSQQRTFIYKTLIDGYICMPSAIMHRVCDAKRIGGYRDVGSVTDVALRLALSQYGEVKFINEYLVKYRVHTSSLSFNTKYVAESCCKLAKLIENEDLIKSLEDRNLIVLCYKRGVCGMFINGLKNMRVKESKYCFKVFKSMFSSYNEMVIFTITHIKRGIIKKLSSVLKPKTALK